MVYQFTIDEQAFAVEIGARQGERLTVTVNGRPYTVEIVQPPAGSAPTVGRVMPVPACPSSASPATSPPPRPAATPDEKTVVAPIPGVIVAISVKAGDPVKAGQTVAVMEAMKMENNLVAPADGVVRKILVQKGAEVATGDVILQIA